MRNTSTESVREIVFDTETTGMTPGLGDEGDRLVEIGCVELINLVPTGRTYHVYINPERDVPADAVAVHGLTTDMLKDKPLFGEVVADFIDFIGNDSKLVAHNAEFDMKFINFELKNAGFPTVDKRRVIDTLFIARQKFPGSPASLDALCRRFGIDNSNRTLHGALLDAELLADVYLDLLGGRQHGFALAEENESKSNAGDMVDLNSQKRDFREARSFPPSAEEIEAHKALLDKIGDTIWAN